MATKPTPRKCLCSPTTHPGSFRCCLHRKFSVKSSNHRSSSTTASSSNKIVTVKANFVKEFLMQIINPSRSDCRRRRNFQPRPTRFCLMNGGSSATDGGAGALTVS